MLLQQLRWVRCTWYETRWSASTGKSCVQYKVFLLAATRPPSTHCLDPVMLSLGSPRTNWTLSTTLDNSSLPKRLLKDMIIILDCCSIAQLNSSNLTISKMLKQGIFYSFFYLKLFILSRSTIYTEKIHEAQNVMALAGVEQWVA